MTKPYSMNTNFWTFWGLGQFFLTFWNLLSMSFPMVYDTIILNEHQFLVIFGPWTDFWVRQGVGGAGPLFWLFEISFPLAFQCYMTCYLMMNTISGYLWALDQFLGGAGSGWGRLKYCRIKLNKQMNWRTDGHFWDSSSIEVENSFWFWLFLFYIIIYTKSNKTKTHITVAWRHIFSLVGGIKMLKYITKINN